MKFGLNYLEFFKNEDLNEEKFYFIFFIYI